MVDAGCNRVCDELHAEKITRMVAAASGTPGQEIGDYGSDKTAEAIARRLIAKRG